MKNPKVFIFLIKLYIFANAVNISAFFQQAGGGCRRTETNDFRNSLSLNSSKGHIDDYRKCDEALSWKTYSTYGKQHVKQFKKYGILYKRSFLTKQELKVVKEELSSLSLNYIKETTSSVAHNRIGAQLPPDCLIVKVLSNPEGSFLKLINELTYSDVNKSQNMILSPIIPIELRIYEQRGASMEWHKDDQLYSPEQLEVVFTVENTSDCVTMWKERHMHADIHETGIELRQVETEPNSAIILRAGQKGPSHSVSALRNGRRLILKFAFIRDDAILMEGAEIHTNQFHPKKSKRNRGSKKKLQ